MKRFVFAVALVAGFCGQVLAQSTFYWDTNGTTAGAGGPSPNGTWSTSVANWNSSSLGTSATSNWTTAAAGNNPQFSAGTDATSPYTVTVVGTVNVNTMRLDEGPTVTFNGGIINFVHAAGTNSILAGIVTAVPTSAVINSQINGSNGFRISRNLGLTNVITISNTANAFSGGVSINSDTTLKLAASGVIPDGNAVTFSTAAGPARLDLNGFNETVKSISGSGTPTITLGVGTLTLDNPAGETFNGVISDTGSVVKNGSGTATFTGANTYTGGTTIGAGVLEIGNGGASGSLASGTGASITNNGTLRFNRSDATSQTIGGVISGTGSIEKQGANTILLTNAGNIYSGSTTISGGLLSVDGDATLGNGAGSLKLSGGTLNATATRTVVVSNPFNLTANSTVTTTSTAASAIFEFSSNSVTGTGGAVLTFRNDGADAGTDVFRPRFSGNGFNFANSIVLAAGSTGTPGATELNLFNTAGVQTFSGTISGATGKVNRSASVAGTGATTEFTGANTYGAGTTVNDGTLLANNTTGSATGSGPVAVGNGATLGGSGAVSGQVNINGGGTLSPGNSVESIGVGTLSFNASATNASHLKYEIGPAGAADLVNAAGATLSIADPTAAGSLAGTMLDLSETTPTYIPTGNKYTVVIYDGGPTGAGWNGKKFKNDINGYVYLSAGPNSRQFLINYKDTTFGSNFAATESAPALASNANTRFVTLVAVPELGSFITMGLMGCCAFGAVRLGRRYGFKALSL
jgi:fibronectin-binding autotransporter adhesin